MKNVPFHILNLYLPKILLNSILKAYVWPPAKQIWKKLVRGKHCFLGVVSTPSKSCFFQIWVIKWPEPKMFIYDKISFFEASTAPKKNFWIITKNGHFTAILSLCSIMGSPCGCSQMGWVLGSNLLGVNWVWVGVSHDPT